MNIEDQLAAQAGMMPVQSTDTPAEYGHSYRSGQAAARAGKPCEAPMSVNPKDNAAWTSGWVDEWNRMNTGAKPSSPPAPAPVAANHPPVEPATKWKLGYEDGFAGLPMKPNQSIEYEKGYDQGFADRPTGSKAPPSNPAPFPHSDESMQAALNLFHEDNRRIREQMEKKAADDRAAEIRAEAARMLQAAAGDVDAEVAAELAELERKREAIIAFAERAKAAKAEEERKKQTENVLEIRFTGDKPEKPRRPANVEQRAEWWLQIFKAGFRDVDNNLADLRAAYAALIEDVA